MVKNKEFYQWTKINKLYQWAYTIHVLTDLIKLYILFLKDHTKLFFEVKHSTPRSKCQSLRAALISSKSFSLVMAAINI